MDSSSFSVHGQYKRDKHLENKSTNNELNQEIEPIPITITHGYSRDRRPDLKQFILDLIVTGDGNIPVFIELAKLLKKTFANATETELSLKQIQSKLKYHRISQGQIIEKKVNNQNNTYQVTGEIQPMSEVIESYKNQAGRFIIATNRLDYESFTADEMLKKYKEQQNVERGFAFALRSLVFCR